MCFTDMHVMKLARRKCVSTNHATLDSYHILHSHIMAEIKVKQQEARLHSIQEVIEVKIQVVTLEEVLVVAEAVKDSSN